MDEWSRTVSEDTQFHYDLALVPDLVQDKVNKLVGPIPPSSAAWLNLSPLLPEVNYRTRPVAKNLKPKCVPCRSTSGSSRASPSWTLCIGELSSLAQLDPLHRGALELSPVGSFGHRGDSKLHQVGPIGRWELSSPNSATVKLGTYERLIKWHIYYKKLRITVLQGSLEPHPVRHFGLL